MLASPGCWLAFTQLAVAGRLRPPYGGLITDAYAVQHPGEPGPQATQSVWVHLITIHLALVGGWPPGRLVEIRRLAADRSAGWQWLEPPSTMGGVTVIDVARAAPAEVGHMVERWVDGAWAAWARHHDAVHSTASALLAHLR